MIDIYSRKADLVMVIGEVNAKSHNWSTTDTIIPEGVQLDSIKSLCGMKQLILESAQILQKSSRCILLTRPVLSGFRCGLILAP